MAEALHRSVSFPGPAGPIEGLLWIPARPNPPVAAVVCHPHPLFGGTMHNKVVYQVARTLDRLEIPVLRFNFRGVGLSGGRHDRGRGEQGDVRAALDYLAAQVPDVPLLVSGFSFGCWVGLRVGCEDSRVEELIGLGAPVNNTNLGYLATCKKPRLLVQGENDQFGSPAKLDELVQSFPADVRAMTRVVIVPGADHFFAGLLEHVDAALTAWLSERHPQLASV
jgi:alpha/beta superfamily hydrolase